MMIMILSMILGSYDEWVHSVFFYRFQVLEKLEKQPDRPSHVKS